jgi:hypothetical protein
MSDLYTWASLSNSFEGFVCWNQQCISVRISSQELGISIQAVNLLSNLVQPYRPYDEHRAGVKPSRIDLDI